MKKFMKYALVATMLMCQGIAVAACIYRSAGQNVQYLEENRPFSGMSFSSDNVTEEYEYDNEWCIRYTDPDAAMYDVEISVTMSAYAAIMRAVRNEQELIGTLERNDGCSTQEREVYSLIVETPGQNGDFQQIRY